MKVRYLVALLIAATVGGIAVASAVTATVSTNSFGAGSATVAKCAASSWTLTPQYGASNTVTGVIVAGIPVSGSPNCNGGTLMVAATDGTSTATGTATISAATMTVSFSGSPSSLQTVNVNKLAASVVGP